MHDPKSFCAGFIADSVESGRPDDRRSELSVLPDGSCRYYECLRSSVDV